MKKYMHLKLTHAAAWQCVRRDNNTTNVRHMNKWSNRMNPWIHAIRNLQTKEKKQQNWEWNWTLPNNFQGTACSGTSATNLYPLSWLLLPAKNGMSFATLRKQRNEVYKTPLQHQNSIPMQHDGHAGDGGGSGDGGGKPRHAAMALCHARVRICSRKKKDLQGHVKHKKIFAQTLYDRSRRRRCSPAVCRWPRGMREPPPRNRGMSHPSLKKQRNKEA